VSERIAAAQESNLINRNLIIFSDYTSLNKNGEPSDSSIYEGSSEF
jgi:hypothetical protein